MTATPEQSERRRIPGRRLTDRQTAVLELVASGLENKEIAHQLGISEQAVKEHVSNLMRRLEARNRAGLAEAAAMLRLVGNADIASEWVGVLFNRAPLLIALLEGAEHRFLAVNEAYRLAAGPGELAGRTFREAFPDLDGAGIVRLLDEAFRTGEARAAPDVAARWYRNGHPETAPGYLTTLVQPMRRQDGSTGGVAFFAFDVTDEVQAQAAARDLSAEREAILEQLPCGVIVVDRDGAVLTLNAAGERIIPFAADGVTKPWEVLELRDLPAGGALPPEDRPLVRALGGQRSPERDYLGVNLKTGERIPLRVSAAPLFDAHGGVRGAIAVFTKIPRQPS